MLVSGSRTHALTDYVVEAAQRQQAVREPQAERQQRNGRHALQPPVLAGAFGGT